MAGKVAAGELQIPYHLAVRVAGGPAKNSELLKLNWSHREFQTCRFFSTVVPARWGTGSRRAGVDERRCTQGGELGAPSIREVDLLLVSLGRCREREAWRQWACCWSYLTGGE